MCKKKKNRAFVRFKGIIASILAVYLLLYSCKYMIFVHVYCKTLALVIIIHSSLQSECFIIDLHER